MNRGSLQLRAIWLLATFFMPQAFCLEAPDVPRLVVQLGHSKQVTAIAFSPDRRTLATGSEDQSAKLWNLSTGREIRSLSGLNGKVHDMAFSPVGGVLATVSDAKHDGVMLWDIASGQKIRSFTEQSFTCYVVTFSHDGKKIAAGCGQEVKVWAVESGELLATLQGHDGVVKAVTFSGDGRWLLSAGSDKSIRVWDAISATPIQSFLGHTDSVHSIAISKDGQTLVSGSDDKSIRVWDTTSGKMTSTTLCKGFVRTVAISPDGLSLLSSSNGDPLTIWEFATMRKLREATNLTGDWGMASLGGFGGQIRGAHAAAFSPDGRAIVSIGDGLQVRDKKLTVRHQVLYWDISRPQNIHRLSKDRADVVVVSADSALAATGTKDGGITIWDLAAKTPPSKFEKPGVAITALAFSPSGHELASSGSDKIVRIWNVKSGLENRAVEATHQHTIKYLAYVDQGRTLVSRNIVGQIELFDESLNKDKSRSLAVSVIASNTTGSAIAIMSPDMRLQVLELASKKSVKLEAGRSVVRPGIGAFSPNGREFAMTAFDGTYAWVNVWNTQNGQLVQTVSDGKNFASTISYASNGRTLLVAGSRGMTAWETDLWRKLPVNVFDSGIKSLSSSGNGTVVVAGGYNGTFLLNLGVENDVRTISGIGQSPTSAAFSADGKKLALGGDDGVARLWDLVTGKQVNEIGVRGVAAVSLLDFSSDGQVLGAAMGGGETMLSNASTGELISKFSSIGEGEFSSAYAWSEDLKKIAVVVQAGPQNILRIIGSQAGKALVEKPIGRKSGSIRFSPDARLLSLADNNSVRIIDATTGKETRAIDEHLVVAQAYSRDMKSLALAKFDGTIKLYDATTGNRLRTFGVAGKLDVIERSRLEGSVLMQLPGHEQSVSSIAFSPNGKILASGSVDNTVRLWSVDSKSELFVLNGHAGTVSSLAFSPDGRHLVSTSVDGSAKLWSVSAGVLLASLYSLEDGNWVVTNQDGRFDTADLEQIKGLQWVVADDPLTPVPIEAFMRDYYEPGLLSRVLAGEKFPTIRSLAELNRVSPEVKIMGVKPDPAANGRFSVNVEVSNISGQTGKQKLYSGAQDLVLFRNRQRVAGIDEDLKIAPGQSKRFEFAGIRLPSSSASIEFSAYAFNSDRVKSQTAYLDYQSKQSMTEFNKPRIYLLNIGIDQYGGAFSSLQYAVADAKAMQEILLKTLGKSRDLKESEIIPVLLVAEQGAGSTNAKKEDIKTVLDLLAGKAVSDQRKKNIPNANKLQAAGPDDTLIVFFAGHGMNGDNGTFHLIPAGPGTDRRNGAQSVESISTDDLTHWLKDVDAGTMVMLLDACHSGAAVAGEGFKPGPMGSRGLGQLAYNKKIRILAASQADDVAMESEKIKHGLMTYALVNEGLQDGRADFKAKDGKIYVGEWLQWGVQRVPTLFSEIVLGNAQLSRGAKRILPTNFQTRPARPQQPTLFDFSRISRDVVLQ